MEAIFKSSCISQYFYHRTKTKYALRNENSIQERLCRTDFSQYCISYCGPYLILSDSDSLQAFKC